MTNKKVFIPFLALTLGLLAALYFSHQAKIIDNQNGQLRMSDYAYHMLIFASVDEPGKSNIYDREYQEDVLSKNFATKVSGAMPIGTPPFVVMALKDFAKFATNNLRLYQTLWSATSLLVLLSALFSWAKLIPENRLLYFVLATFFLSLLSPIFHRVIEIGQTSIFATGILLHILLALETKKISSLKLSIQAILLAIKPTYLLLAFALLLSYKQKRASTNLVVLTIILSCSSLVLFSVGDIKQYLGTLLMYSSGNIPPYYQASIVYDRINNLPTALSGLFNIQSITPVSNILFYLGVFAATLMALLDKLPKRTAALAIIASYLLFCPYLIAEEEILILLAALLAISFASFSKRQFFLLILIAFVISNHNTYGSALNNMWLFFCAKILLFGWLIRQTSKGTLPFKNNL